MSVVFIYWYWIHIYMILYWISFQHLRDECKLGDFCAPCGRRVGVCRFLKLNICIGYVLPTFGEQKSV